MKLFKDETTTERTDDLGSEVMRHYDDEKPKDKTPTKDYLSESDVMDWDDTFMSTRWKD